MWCPKIFILKDDKSMNKIRTQNQKISPNGYLLISISIISTPLLTFILYITYGFFDFWKSHPDTALFGWLCFAIPLTVILFLTIIMSGLKIKKLLGKKPSYFYFIFITLLMLLTYLILYERTHGRLPL